VVRSNAADQLGVASNARRVSDIVSAVSPGAAQRTVRVRYLSGWSQVYLRWVEQGNEREVGLRRVGPGRGGSEALWEGTVQTREPTLQFELHDGSGGRDRAPGGSRYATRLTSLTLASGELYAGARDGNELRNVSKSEVVHVSNWRSNVLGNSRDIFVYLPRGYRSSTRRYPVLYAQDGQNLFGPDTLFGGWRLGEAADKAIKTGRMAEVIIVGVGNTPARMDEYVPEADGGQASRYAKFLTDELKPWVDRSLRTQPQREHTGVIGSSLGGLVSLYLGWEHPNVFGKVASLSGSFWIQRWVATLGPRPPPQPLTVYLDSGTVGGSSHDSLEDTLRVRDRLLGIGYVLGKNLLHQVDNGASHNEQYWRARVHTALEFLFPAE